MCNLINKNKLTNKIATEAWTHGTDRQLLEGKGAGDWMKEGEEVSQRTYMYYPWTQSTVW